ncbi:MAG: hypothetical protein IT276_00945 [Ignavibacteriaceae bacterium]|nr:hypothetical protein [Ignavibacteriaceae bacterium]HMN25974.1 hypothetical protein [Ignavibacteriaceae bacterium]HRN28069.1 hypothetical protein [Ignavibacteriaceae bacterium]HRP94483.1 hypothetical protein [Ignavibacteriaceae bacterium]HRQ55616.1 hypothetical protein [Ignavibacteriaceae bacterium]
MRTKRLENFSTFYFDTSGNDIENMISELKEAGIDPDNSGEKILKRIKKERINLKIEKAKRAKERVEDFIKKKFDSLSPLENDEQLVLAYRKLEGLDSDDELLIKKDAALLEKLKKIISEENNET